MLFGILSGVPDVITHAKFYVNRLRGFSVAAHRKWPFPTPFRTNLTTVLHYRADCDVTSAYLYENCTRKIQILYQSLDHAPKLMITNVI